MKIRRHTTRAFLLQLAIQMCVIAVLSSNVGVGANAQATHPRERTTTARAGDTVNKIAHRFGVEAAEVARLNGLTENSRVRRGTIVYLPESSTQPTTPPGEIVGNTITLADGYTFQADEVWHENGEIWYRKGNVTASLSQAVKSVKPIYKAAPAPQPAPAATVATPLEAPIVWIHLVDGAKFRVDDVQETSEGAWYSRASISSFLEKDRIARIEREVPGKGKRVRTTTDWTSGNPAIDQMIRNNGDRFGVDPYLVFLVIEKESKFHPRALSPKGAQGLMQLMPSTARRFGVSRPYDPGENIKAGTQYLRELMDMFDGQVNLVLASYNAGEGAVLKYGRNVPPYRETRDYVKTIGKRYGLSGRQSNPDTDVPNPQQ